MTVELNVKDRLVLVSILPVQGKMTDLVEVIDLIRLIKLTDDEKTEIGYTEKEGRIFWDITKENPREFEINFEQLRIIKESIKKMDDEGKIDLSILNTCLKFSKL
jgi:hypothetical protein